MVMILQPPLVSNILSLKKLTKFQQRYNFSNALFDEEASGGIVIHNSANRSAKAPQPFAAENIVIVLFSVDLYFFC